MRRAGIAFLTVAVAALGGAACGPDLPDRLWRSDNVRYLSRDGDAAVCPAILDELEQHGQVIADTLLIGRTTVSYYKFDGSGDFALNADCGPGAAACAPNATVRSPIDFDRHELIHAYLSRIGRPPWLLAEGAAVALSCQAYPRPTGTWQDALARQHEDPALYAAGGWLVGYLLRMFPARLLPRLYERLAIDATADQFARVFEEVYEASIDDIWASVIGGPGQPMRCPWECGRPAFAVDGQARPLAPVCAGGTLQLSVDLPGSGLSRWRVDGPGRVKIQSCDGADAPFDALSGMNGTGELLASLAPGGYFLDAVVETGARPTLSATVTPGEGLSWSDCASAPAIPDELAGLATLMLFYPGSTTPQFTSFAAGTARSGEVLVASPDPSASARLCASCDGQTCASIGAGQSLPTQATGPGTVVNVPAGPSVTATFSWF